jgi:hypothetical protein
VVFSNKLIQKIRMYNISSNNNTNIETYLMYFPSFYQSPRSLLKVKVFVQHKNAHSHFAGAFSYSVAPGKRHFPRTFSEVHKVYGASSEAKRLLHDPRYVKYSEGPGNITRVSEPLSMSLSDVLVKKVYF